MTKEHSEKNKVKEMIVKLRNVREKLGLEKEKLEKQKKMEIEMNEEKKKGIEGILAVLAEQEKEKNELLQRIFLMEEQVMAEQERLERLENECCEEQKKEKKE